MKHVELLNNKQYLYNYLINCSERDFYCKIGADLKNLRRKNGYTQTEIATYLGVTFQQVQKYETGKNRIPVRFILMLMDLFKVDLHELLGQKDPNEDLKARMDIMEAHQYESLKENQKVQKVQKEVQKENQQLKTKVAKQDEEIKTLKEGTIKENEDLRTKIMKLQAENKELKDGLVQENQKLKNQVKELQNTINTQQNK